jgi:hypothetical protein
LKPLYKINQSVASYWLLLTICGFAILLLGFGQPREFLLYSSIAGIVLVILGTHMYLKFAYMTYEKPEYKLRPQQQLRSGRYTAPDLDDDDDD